MPTALTVRLLVVQATDREQLEIRDARAGDAAPDDKHTWLHASLKRTYDDKTTVFGDALVTWECWLLIGTDGVKANLRDEIKKSRRRQLRAGKERLPHARAVTFILSNDG
jgi:hypothetical protein